MDRIDIIRWNWSRLITRIQRYEKLDTKKEAIEKLGITTPTYYNILNEASIPTHTLNKVKEKQREYKTRSRDDRFDIQITRDRDINEKLEEIQKQLDDIKQSI